MGDAKSIRVAPISSADARLCIKRFHYSGKVVNNSQIHFGVFVGGTLEGALQFGPSLDKRRMLGLVRGTEWNQFLELNRMAFGPALPRNSESRAISVCIRMIRKHAAQVKWIVSFADGTQCGDGTIYRASGFLLTGIRRNTSIWSAPTGETFSRTSLTDGKSKQQQQQARNIINRTSVTKGKNILEDGGASMRRYKDAGFEPLPGYQLRYVLFLDRSWIDRLTVPILPFNEIAKVGAQMYLGKRAGSIEHDDVADDQSAEGGASPTPALHPSGRCDP